MDTGKLLAELRKKKGLSQAELASAAGITQASLSHIENGSKKPHKSTIDKLCEALDMPPQMFYFLTIREEDLPDSSREKFTSIESDLKKLILDTF
jgi:transcriptional regulator with XRE-family HTH domain